MTIPGLGARSGMGAGWGVAIVVVAVFLGGAGHGVFAPLGVFCAPFSLLGTQWAWICCVPFGALLAAVAPLRAFRWVALSHYVAAVAAVTIGGFDDWKAVPGLPASFVALFSVSIVIYLTGHALLWRAWIEAEAITRAAKSAIVDPIEDR